MATIQEQFQALWPSAKVYVHDDSWHRRVELTSDSTLYLNFGQIMKIALILDTDKFEIDKDKETETWALSEITWDSSTTYTMAFWVPFKDVGVWTDPAVKEFASKMELTKWNEMR